MTLISTENASYGIMPLAQKIRSPDELLTTDQLANTLHISKRTPEAWRLTGEGPPFVRAGKRRVLYRWGSVLEWLTNQEVRSTSEEAAS